VPYFETQAMFIETIYSQTKPGLIIRSEQTVPHTQTIPELSNSRATGIDYFTDAGVRYISAEGSTPVEVTLIEAKRIISVPPRITGVSKSLCSLFQGFLRPGVLW
jgi:hypothetical protein